MITCDFGELLNNLLLCFTLGNRTNEQPVVGDRYTHADVLPWADLVIITLWTQTEPAVRPAHAVLEDRGAAETDQPDGLLRRLFSAECDEGIAPVQTAQRVHHQPQVPDRSSVLEERNQLVFKQVPGNLANKNLVEEESLL